MASRKIGIVKEKNEICASNQGAQPRRKKRGNRENVDEYAAYAFDILQSLREASTEDRHKFLGYLIGMASEEAIRLAEGHQSAAAQFGGQALRKTTRIGSSQN